MQIGSSFRQAPSSFMTFWSFRRPKCFAFDRNSFFTFSDAPGRRVETATKLDLGRKSRKID